jgi:YNFM family putative membrane transporter
MRNIRIGLFGAGLATFALLYTPQPLLPLLSAGFGASPAAASLSMSAGTAALAVAIIPVSSLSEVYGRRRIMTISVVAAAIFGIATAFAPSLAALIGIRIAEGVALAGMPASAMAYLREEIDAGAFGRAMGVFVAGNGIGGLAGRIIAGLLADAGGWRVAFAGVSGVSLACAIGCAVMLPRSRFFTPAPPRPAALLGSLRRNLTDSRLARLYLIGFALMGAYVTVYNYLTYRVSEPPFSLSPTVVGLLFTVYLAGTYASSKAGGLADRFGRYGVLVGGTALTFAGVALTLPASLALIVIGLILLTAGFFAAHSVASGWVARAAPVAPAQSSALYLCLYYVGSSVAGSAGGVFYARGGWPETVVFVVILLAVALASGLTLRWPRRREAGRPPRAGREAVRPPRAGTASTERAARAGSPPAPGRRARPPSPGPPCPSRTSGPEG